MSALKAAFFIELFFGEWAQLAELVELAKLEKRSQKRTGWLERLLVLAPRRGRFADAVPPGYINRPILLPRCSSTLVDASVAGQRTRRGPRSGLTDKSIRRSLSRQSCAFGGVGQLAPIGEHKRTFDTGDRGGAQRGIVVDVGLSAEGDFLGRDGAVDIDPGANVEA